MTKITGKILVISEKDETGSILGFVLDFENTKFNKKIIDEINQKKQGLYDYIIFHVKNDVELVDYIYYEFFAVKNIYISRELFNTILLENVKFIVDTDRIELLSVLKYIMDEDIKETEFSFYKMCKKLKNINHLRNSDMKKIKTIILNTIKDYYSQDNYFRKLNFHIKKNKIVKVFFYKILKNIQNDINRTIIYIDQNLCASD